MSITSDDDYLRGPDGRPLVDRYGRPIRRRPRHTDATVSGGHGAVHSPERRPTSPSVPPRGIEEHRRRMGESDPYGSLSDQASSQPYWGDPPGPVGPSGPIRPSRPGSEPSRRRWRSSGRRRGLLSGWWRKLRALVGVLFLVAIGTLVWVDLHLHRVDALENYAGRPSGGSGSNWLLVGSDSREGLSEDQQAKLATGGDTGGGRTDSIIVAHVPLLGKATMVSIPRDSYVDIPGYGKNKVNAAFALGGPKLLQRTVEQATGLRINHYAEIGFGGFASVVDAVGGVNICVEQPMDDPLAGINVQPGCQKFDGPTALGFVRSRHSMDDGDIGRARNQRTFLAALVKKAISPGTFMNPFRFFPFVSRMSDSFTVDKHDHVWDLARLGIGLGRSPETKSIPIAS